MEKKGDWVIPLRTLRFLCALCGEICYFCSKIFLGESPALFWEKSCIFVQNINTFNLIMEFNIKQLHYDIDQVLEHFGLTANTECPLIDDWLSLEIPREFVLPDFLEKQRKRLVKEGAVWNEEELKMHFLSFVLTFAEMEVPNKIKLFYERQMTETVQGTPLNVICDAVLATPLGINTPKSPYFFLQEFKKRKKTNDDPEGQMLVAMLIAQEKNKDGKPIYGCWVQGKDWTFTTLHEKNYCFSKTLDAAEIDELQKIIFALRKLKDLVL